MNDAPKIKLPAIVFAAGNELIVNNDGVEAFYKALGTPDDNKEYHFCEGMKHDIFLESEREKPLGELRRFFLKHV